jgi:hypothetical protein
MTTKDQQNGTAPGQRKAKPLGVLTDTVGEQAKATEKAQEVADGSGPYPYVNTGGSKL